MSGCPFCDIAEGRADAVVLWQDDYLVAFLDRAPVREGHAHIIPRLHYETFELLPQTLASLMIIAGQDVARRLKRVYDVDRVAFLLTGGDVPHVHAHLIPMHAKTDVTSARYLICSGEVRWSSDHLHTPPEELRRVRATLGYAAPVL